MLSRAKPSSREASVPEDTVRNERIMGLLYRASLAGTGLIVIGRCTLINRLGADFPRHRNCRNRTDG
jgi:hypothetical protein